MARRKPKMNDNLKNRKKLGRLWVERLREAAKAEEYWRKDAQDAEKMFSNQGLARGSTNTPDTKVRFNILHSNVETIVPAIYNSTPEPDIRTRWINQTQANELAKETGRVLERSIKVQIDDNGLDEEVEMMAQDAYAVGRGILRIRFDADVEEEVETDPDTGEERVIEDSSRTVNERLEFESVAWRDFRMGFAQRWSDVPWVAFRHHLSRETMSDITDSDLKEFEDQVGGIDAYMTNDERELCKDHICVWEIWNKSTKTVRFLREADGMIVKTADDPLGLQGFFPMPQPMTPIRLNGSMTPICPFAIYKDLAEELDTISKRIKYITTGLRVRGLFAGDSATGTRLAEANDNELITLPDPETLSQLVGLDQMIQWWPNDQAVAVLNQLYQNRELTKQAIYEITGIADIVRGQTDPQETLGAQEIKTQWGSLRIQKMQRGVQRIVRDTFCICAELIAQHFTPETLQLMTGLEITPQMQQLLDMPVLRHYRVDVESDSTIRADLTKARGEMSEFLNGTAQFFAAMAPIVQDQPETAPALAEIYGAFARHFKLGKQPEDALEQLIEQVREQYAAQQQQPSIAEQARMDEVQAKIQDDQAKRQLERDKLTLEIQNLYLDAQKAEYENRIKAEELGIKRQELDIKSIDVEAKIVKDQEEIQLEREQRRPVRIGP